ncbi:MFS transporter [Pseudonocardia sp. EC080610-09]|uniref:MFS transporter n=1 Tax=unclassified Pseudonocardia TaxID=2619320 RepID=UPI0006CAFB75|nr:MULTISPECIES: MFS transporter [unclassified Pseudonocardia]ALE73914.1 MFS transporter [Pseudonocardia sp. EC080625-04]ALL77306.1 MFS transporter [Pseudonocardia sp. EC080610-09]ALL80222.1 MFS transporter [Pseudonocardia sp. EC080619-01]
MSATVPPASPGQPAAPALRSSRKVATASLIGTTIEWYDFFIFGTAAALVFGQVFFPSVDPLTGTLSAFGAFAVGFIARPVGGAVFAHFGDRVGRKPMLVYSLLLMGAATVGMGLLPGYDTLGIWAPILLVTLRFLQGFGVGGEWGGAALMAVEHAPAHRRGYYGSWPQVGVPLGLVMGTATFAVLSAVLTDEQFLAWGWRVPFIGSIALIGVGMWIRLGVHESPVFQKTMDEKSANRMPVVEALRTYPKEILLAAGSFLATNSTFYVGSVWLVTYATQELAYERTTILTANAFLSLSDIPMILLFGLLSDRLGRRPMFLAGMGCLALFAVPYFWLVSTSNVWLFILGGLVVQACRSAVYGPQSAFFAEQFSTRMRYSGASLAYQIASILGGVAPLLCTALVAWTGSLYAVAGYVAFIALVSMGCSYLMTETLRTGLRDETATPAAVDGRTGTP